MEGKILYNNPKYEININNVNSSDTQNSSNCGNIIGNKFCQINKVCAALYRLLIFCKKL